MRRILHIDMDAFFAAVEERRDPGLKGKPVVIGGMGDPSRRGVVSTANYEARKYGIHSAMPLRTAYKLCPKAVFLPVDYEAYEAASRLFKSVLLDITSIMENAGIDEAYLDISDEPDSNEAIVAKIRAGILEKTGLTCSIGIAPNKFLAKIASDLNKPDGLFVLPPEQVETFVASLPLKKIPGIGAKTAERLAALGLHCGADVLAYPAHELLRQFGKCGQMLLQRVRGIDQRPVEVEHVRKSVGVEVTLPADLHQWKQAAEVLSELQRELLRRLEKHRAQRGIASLGVKLKFSDFTQTCVERRSQGIEPEQLRAQLQQAWSRGAGKGVRLVGIVAGLQAPLQSSDACQLALEW